VAGGPVAGEDEAEPIGRLVMADDDNDRADDYEYDEAHDTGDTAATSHADLPPVLRPPAAMHVTDDAGDYCYDAAHDR